MRNGRFDDFEYTCRFVEGQKKTFQNILEKLILNIDVRFPCPSTGIESRLARQNIDVSTNTVNRQFFQSVRTRCPLFLMVEIFMFPDMFIKQRTINPFFVSGRFPEINRIVHEVINNEECIINAVNSTDNDEVRGELKLKTITLLDVFNTIKPDGYPFLWDITMKALTIQPTSVNCEQNFSRLRHKLHENMSKKTSFAFMTMSQKRKVLIF